MGRITDILPALYHGGDNDVTRFTNILDAEIKGLERSTRGITDLINIDKCPDDKLPYLAALINCPLIGDDPIFWRKQIRNWPYILRLKGTQKSLELVLDSIDVEDSTIKTFFRNEHGKYVTTKPDGEPFIDINGLWRNIRTHYFGIDLTLSRDFVESKNFDWDEAEISTKLQFWLERGKPYHAELLHLNILPPDLLPDDHICRWDDCIWGHPFIELHDWGLLTLPVFENDPVAGIDFVRAINVIGKSQALDVSMWERGFIADLQRESTATWFIPHCWGKFSWGESERYSRDFEMDFQRDAMSVDADIKTYTLGTAYVIGMIASLQPYWDFYTWTQHGNWGERFGIPRFAPGFQRDNKASVQWSTAEAPYATWSKFRTWGNSTWDKAPTSAGTWQTGSWIDDLEEAS